MIEEQDQKPRPALVQLTSYGRDAWQRFTEAHPTEINRDYFLPHLKGPWAMLRGFGARLALVLHFR
jgi:hypothetical protein